jgi:hypothetical protein
MDRTSWTTRRTKSSSRSVMRRKIENGEAIKAADVFRHLSVIAEDENRRDSTRNTRPTSSSSSLTSVCRGISEESKWQEILSADLPSKSA